MHEIFETAIRNQPEKKNPETINLQDVFEGKLPANNIKTSAAITTSQKESSIQVAAVEANLRTPENPEPNTAFRQVESRCVAGDADNDGLDDCFEKALSESFTPFYHVSQGEPNNFASFYSSVPQNVMQTYGQSPFSHYRVKPLGFVVDPNTGQQYGAIRIDYLTLWDYDNGLASGGSYCGWPIGNLELGGHELDNERSAVLVYAPTSSFNTFSDNVYFYGARLYYTAAHEGTITDKSLLLYVTGAPIPSGLHIQLALSKSKPGTYPYNPNGLPLLPWWLMQSVLTSLQSYCAYASQNGFGWGDAACLAAVAAVAAAYNTFYGCVVEVFQDQGGSFANPQYNVGEPYLPRSCCVFIQDNTPRSSYLYNKLVYPTFGNTGW